MSVLSPRSLCSFGWVLVGLAGCQAATGTDDAGARSDTWALDLDAAGLDASGADARTSDALADVQRADSRDAGGLASSACVSDECALGGVGCAATEACRITAANPRPHCEPNGTRPFGSFCDDDPSSCEAPLVCHRHRCRWPCCTDGTTPGAFPACPSDWCRPLVEGLGACDEEVCDLLFPTETCSPGETCDVVGEDGTVDCRLVGTAVEGEPCAMTGCVAGLGCVRSASDPGRCLRWCDPTQDGYPCPGECTPALGWGVCSVAP